jgi:hypothetical protein
MLWKEGFLVLTKKEYYNLCRKAEGGGRLTRQEEIMVIIKYLEDEGFYVQVRYEYAVDDNGERTGVRVVWDIFFINDA